MEYHGSEIIKGASNADYFDAFHYFSDQCIANFNSSFASLSHACDAHIAREKFAEALAKDWFTNNLDLLNWPDLDGQACQQMHPDSRWDHLVD
jgi:hypothetical protein